MKAVPSGGTDAFYRRLLQEHGVYVGPGHWFEMSDCHFRIGYGWPTGEELDSGLAGISAALRGDVQRLPRDGSRGILGGGLLIPQYCIAGR